VAALILRFAPDHPAAAGHFPGNPIIPGACLLSETVRAIASQLRDGGAPGRLRYAKFLHPVRPGDRLAIHFERDRDGVVRFACAIGTTTALTGQIEWQTTRAAE